MTMSALGLDIIYQDDEFLVVNKPSGLLAVPGRGPDAMDSIAHRVRTNFPPCIDQPAVHRLDMDTSGLMLLARTRETHRHLSIQFEKKQVSKRYIALVHGFIEESGGEIALSFRLDPENRPYQIYDAVHGKAGHTLWKKLGFEDPYTRIEFTPLTGRTHQLRLHAAHRLGLGAPIVDDPLYGTGTEHGKMKLHAAYLGFFHPATHEFLELRSPAPF